MREFYQAGINICGVDALVLISGGVFHETSLLTGEIYIWRLIIYIGIGNRLEVGENCCDLRRRPTPTALKVSVFGIFLVHIFPHSD